MSAFCADPSCGHSHAVHLFFKDNQSCSLCGCGEYVSEAEASAARAEASCHSRAIELLKEAHRDCVGNSRARVCITLALRALGEEVN